MKKLLLLTVMSMFLISLASAQLIYTKDQSAEIQIPCINNGTACSGSATCNITVIYPNSTLFINNQLMTNGGAGTFSYALASENTSILGEYQSTVFCTDGSFNGYSTFPFWITGNGKEDAEGIVVVFFSLAFIILSVMLMFLLFYGIGHFKEHTFDLAVLSWNVGGYIGLIALYMLEKFYLGNVDMEGIMLTVIEIGAVTNVLIPFVGFIVSYLYHNTKSGDHN